MTDLYMLLLAATYFVFTGFLYWCSRVIEEGAEQP